MEIKTYLPYIKPLFLGLCFFLLLCGYQTTQNFQSGINKNDGYISIALVYGFCGIGQFVSPILVDFLTPKFSLFFGGICYVFYIATNVYLIRSLYFIASGVCGFGSSLLWAASSTLLSGYEQKCSHPSYIYTLFYVPVYFNFLGNIIPMIFSPSTPAILFMVLTCVTALAVFLYLFSFNSPPVPMENMKELLLASLKCFSNWRLVLLFPLALLFGFSRSFYYTSMPVLAPLNVTSYIYISMGITMTLSTFCWGFFNSKFTERITLFISVFAETLAVILGFIINEVYLHNTTNVPQNDIGLDVCVCVLGGIAGIADSGLESITIALLNKIWPKQVAPLSAWRVVYYSVMCIALLYSSYITTRIVLIIFGASAIFGLITLIFINIMYNKIYKEYALNNNETIKHQEEKHEARAIINKEENN
ncbi:hypothetical protein CL6EHI_073610 [Entamoeba histolytica]|uniref:UNC93-like protein MFSD11 n=4 Tax=Entamoeba histolytica TaxID=5759 RepID=C4LXM1_ENTH1|nr:hypothetical protein EHI_073610 [Entamoeba histolytica HM-1:IMSS]EAL48577.1 hypothetical protein EHI_073610 [Entamoeba histolytica HM-1:IMSS]ENY63153.1 hypothetical protein EHI7A_071130 [Entamoeba histolytica HM-1:IMSS-A]GAT93508.1 hypothetical protein CL6EHI_073610 [Entamoeba histolytica]|eukprot:XP_653963.1 hypothetical protein EHI_073610 [Entamoeba histolytica HM-1:IMSS]